MRSPAWCFRKHADAEDLELSEYLDAQLSRMEERQKNPEARSQSRKQVLKKLDAIAEAIQGETGE